MYALGQMEIQPYPTPSQIVAGEGQYAPETEWETLFRTEVGTVGPTPIVTSQSPPPPPAPVYSLPSYSQSMPTAVPLPITLAALAIGGLLLFFLVRGIRA